MKLRNFICINDWDIKSFLILIISIQISVFGIFLFELIGYELQIISSIITLIYIAIIPGMSLLRILRIHKLSSIETLVYSVSLSLATTMLLLLFTNFVYPYLHIDKPISEIPLLATFLVFNIILSFFSYIRNRNASCNHYFNINDLVLPKNLFLLIIPFFAIFGSYYNLKNLAFLLFLCISLVVFLVGLNKYSKRYYPLIIFIISVSILYNSVLISPHVWGWDINYEYFLSNLTKINAFWDVNFPLLYNTSVSTTLITPVLSIFSNLNINWTLKFYFPLFFTLIPLMLYKIFQKITLNDKLSFLSVFFFISISTYYVELLQVTRQQIGELFLVSLISVIFVKNNLTKRNRAILSVIFLFSIILAHYGLSYIFMGIFTLTFITLWLISKINIEKIINAKFFKEKENITNLSSTFIILFIVFGLSWYIFTSSSRAFESFSLLINNIATNIFDIFNPETSGGLATLTTKIQTPFLGYINATINYLNQGFLVLGIIFGLKTFVDKKEYLALSLACLSLLILSIVLPFFAQSLNMTRLYHIVLIILAPFCIIGFMISLKYLSKKFWNILSTKNIITLAFIYFLIFFNFQNGVIYESVVGTSNHITIDKDYYFPYLNSEEINSLNWLANKKDQHAVYSDEFQYRLLINFVGYNKSNHFKKKDTSPNNVYLFFGSYNIKSNKILIKKKYLDYEKMIKNKNKIFDNGFTNIYK